MKWSFCGVLVQYKNYDSKSRNAVQTFRHTEQLWQCLLELVTNKIVTSGLFTHLSGKETGRNMHNVNRK